MSPDDDDDQDGPHTQFLLRLLGARCAMAGVLDLPRSDPARTLTAPMAYEANPGIIRASPRPAPRTSGVLADRGAPCAY